MAIVAQLMPLNRHLRDDMAKFTIFVMHGIGSFGAAPLSDAAGDPPQGKHDCRNNADDH